MKSIIINTLLDQKRKIFVQIVTDVSNLSPNGLIGKENQIPLLLDCGHPICSKCMKKEKFRNCPVCNKVILDRFKPLLPLNLYALGLIVSSCHRPLDNDDEEFVFCRKLSKQLQQIKTQG